MANSVAELKTLKEVLEIPASKEWEYTIKLLLRLIGEDPNRPGLRRTPLRVKRALQFLTAGYNQDPAQLFKRAIAKANTDEMIIVKDIDFFSLCIHGKSIVYTPQGYRFAWEVHPGEHLLTLEPHTRCLVETEVLAVSVSKHRERFRVRFSNGRTLILSGEHPVHVINKGFVPADKLHVGDMVLGVHGRSLLDRGMIVT